MALRKIYSGNGPIALQYPDHPNDYRFYGNADYLAQANAYWMKFWVSWYDLQEHYKPSGASESWSRLASEPTNTKGRPLIRELDMQIKAANDGGRSVILTLYHTYPTWANGASTADPYNGNRGPNQKVPSDCSTTGPFGWFIQFLCARYIRGYQNDPAGGLFGNPSGARIDVLEVVNEPNLLLWPQSGLEHKVAQMVETAEAFSVWASNGGATLPLAIPATSDFPDPADGYSSNWARNWEEFTGSVLNRLAYFRPRCYVVWSHHNYKDIKYGPLAVSKKYRVKRVNELLYERNWRGGGNRHTWVTEGGLDLRAGEDYRYGLCGTKSITYPTYTLTTQNTQSNVIQNCFNGYQGIPDVVSYAHHTISDHYYGNIDPNVHNYGLRDRFDSCALQPRDPRLAWHTFRDLGPWMT